MSESEQFVVGKCKWFNKDKGYGFVKVPDDSLDIFVHANQLRKSGIERSLNDGETLRFVREKGPKGVFATKITIVEG